MWIEGVLAYGGTGWSAGVQHTLEAARRAVRCEPAPGFARTKDTLELDHAIASVFGLWSEVLPRSKLLRAHPQLQLPAPGFASAAEPKRPRKKSRKKTGSG